MSTGRVCSRCGAPLTGVGNEQLCPGCLLEGGLASAAEAHVALDPSQSANPNSQTQDLFPRPYGDYELLEEIARGGMGIVYKARQASLDRIVAVKMLLLGPLANPEFVQRFRTEAATAASLHHPNIVAIHEVGYRDGQHFFAMDYVEGQNLAMLVANQPLPARRAAGYVKTVAEAIHFAHERSILHRDLKPSNVLIDTATDQPRVTDFGLAKRLDKDTELTLSGQVLGSPNYMPPEQAAAHRGLVGKRSDVYSLGAILYHLLTGRPPFMAATVGETLQQVQTADPVSPTILNPHLPHDLKTICLKCLEKEPARRYQTAQELVDELDHFLENEPILARPVGRPEKVWRWCRRKPLVAALSTATVLAILLGFAGVTRQGQKASKARDAAQRRLYAAQISQAFRAWDVGNLRTARALLDDQRPQPGAEDLRGAEWRWLWSLCQSEAKTVLSNRGGWMVPVAEPSPDGCWVATAGASTNITLYDLTGKDEPRTLRGHTRPILSHGSVAFSPDGRRLVSASGGLFQPHGPCEFFLWDLATGSYTNLVGHSNWLCAVAYSRDGRWLGSACQDGTVGLWDADARINLALLRAHQGPVHSAVFSPDSRSLFTGGEDGLVRCWDVMTRREIGPPMKHSWAVAWIAVAPDGRTLATAGTDQYLHLWNLTSRQERRLRYSPAERPGAPVFSPDGRLLAFGTGNNIRIWDLEAEQERTILRGSAGPIRSLRFLPDGKRLVSASELDRPMLWDLERPERLITLRGFRECVLSMALSSDQRWLVVGSGDFNEPERPAEVVVFDFASQQPLLPPLEHPAAVNSVSLTPDGKLLATGCADGQVRLFTLPGGQLFRTLTNAVINKLGNLAFSPDGRTLVTYTAAPKQFVVWKTATWEATPLLQNPPPTDQGFAFSPDGSLLVTALGGANCAVVWNMPWGTTNTLLPMDNHTSGAAFSPDGTLLAVKAYWNIALFDVKTWRQLATLRGHEHIIFAMAFSPDGKTLASVGIDGSLRLWSVPARAEVAVLWDHVDVTMTVAFTSDGHWLISGGNDKTVKLRRIPSLEEIQAAESSKETHRQ